MTANRNELCRVNKVRSDAIDNVWLIVSGYSGAMPDVTPSTPRCPPQPLPSAELDARYDITVDVARHLMRYRLAGLFDAAAIEGVRARQAEAARMLRCLPNRHVTLLDIAGCRIQTQEIIAAFSELLDDPRHRSRALAVVAGSSLARRQLARILRRPGVQFFASVEEAEAWLFADAASAGADRVAH